MTIPTDDDYRDAALMISGTLVGHEAEVIRTGGGDDGGAYVTIRVWIPASATKAIKGGLSDEETRTQE